MAYTTIHTKKNGVKYVYSVEGYWDKDKKAPRNRQVCLGRLDEKTGEVIPSSRKKRVAKRAAKAPEVTATSKIIGPSLLLDKISHEIGLPKVLRRCFPNCHLQLLSLAYFLVQKGHALSRSEIWSATNVHPLGEVMPSQRTSELLNSITEDGRQMFFSKWMKTICAKEYLCYDITSISSYSEGNEYVRWGHNRDLEKLPQVNLAMLFGQNSGLPAYYRRLPGSIPDVATLKTTMDALDFIENKKLTFVLDRGFYSASNVDALFAAHYDFILAVPTSRIWIERIIDKHRDEIMLPDHYHVTGENESLFMLTHLHQWKGKRCYLQIYYNNAKAAEDYDAFTTQLLHLKQELETKNERSENADDYKRFFVVKETPKRGRKIMFNNSAIEEYRKKYVGFFCLLTKKKLNPFEALELYRRKEKVENCFDDMKNQLDMKRLRIHSSQAMDARLFVQFLALILLTKVRLIIKRSKELKNLTVREVMEAMETITEIKYSGRYGSLITEAGLLQREIMAAFGLPPETLLHDSGK